MQVNLTPIEKHKSQIQKRISLLEQKFKEKENPRDNTKRLKDLIYDQNTFVPHQTIINSKTVQIRGKIKNQVDSSKPKKESISNQSNIPHQTLINQTELLRNTVQMRQPKDSKDQKISELYDMMRSILEGQRNIEKELSQLKKQQLRQSNKKAKNQSKINKVLQNQAANESIIENLSRTREKKIDKSIRIDVSKNQSFLYQQNQELKPSKSPNKKLKGKKNCNFDDLVNELKGKQKNGERICVGDQWKGRIWAEVQERVKQSEKEYKDTIHRNNKHQFEHLMSTFQLQRKLKDQLIDKVYSQANNQLYK